MNVFDLNSKLKVNTFMLETTNEHEIDIKDLSQKFNIDVSENIRIVDEYNTLGLYIRQNNEDIFKPYNVCDTTTKINKNNNEDKLKGFVKKSFDESYKSIYTFPSELIPEGCWCYSCYVHGPLGHRHDCSNPCKNNLGLTLSGFIDCIDCFSNSKLEKKLIKIKDIINKFRNEINNLKNIYNGDTLLINAANNISILYNKDEILNNNIKNIKTNIDYNQIKKMRKKYDIKTPIANALLLSYINDFHKKTSIRIYENTTSIVFISCDPNDYKKMIDLLYTKIRNLYAIKLKTITVSSINISFMVFHDNNDNINYKTLNIDIIDDIFNPTDLDGNPLLQNNFIHTVNNEKYINKNIIEEISEHYQIQFQYNNIKNKINIDFFLKQIMKKTLIKINYKISAQIWKTGSIQLTITYLGDQKSNKKYIDNEYNENYDYKDILNEINYELNEAKNIANLLKKIIIKIFIKKYENNINLVKNNVIKISDKLHDTVPGVMPYKKVTKIVAGTIVDIFDDNNENWKDNFYWSPTDHDRGIVVKIVGNNYYIVSGKPFEKKYDITKDEYDLFLKKNVSILNLYNNGKDDIYLLDYNSKKTTQLVVEGKYKIFSLFNLRPYKNNYYDDKLSSVRANEQVNKYGPVPFSFYGKCKPGEIVDRIGQQSRKDNKFYPKCVQLNDNNKKEIINFILKGLTNKQLEEAHINNEDIYFHGVKLKDKYCGTFKPGTTRIGNIITFWDEKYNKWRKGTIINKTKDNGSGSDNLHVIYNIKIINEDEDEDEDEDNEDENEDNEDENQEKYTITGDLFHPIHREYRNFEGLEFIFNNNETECKKFLINCAKDLGLVKPEINIPDINNNQILNNMNNILNKYNIKFENFDLMNINFFNYFLDYPYMAAIIPYNSIRYILYIFENNCYLINTNNNIKQVNIGNIGDKNFEIIIDGFIDEENKYYPVDILTSNNYNYNDRLKDLINICDNITYGKDKNIKIINPEKFIGPTNKNESIIQFIYDNLQKDNILFISQINNKHFLWKKYNFINNFIIQIITKNNNLYSLGYSINGENIILFKDIYIKKNFNLQDYIFIETNNIKYISNANITLKKISNLTDKYIKNNINIINSLLYKVNENIFKNIKVWIIEDINLILQFNNDSNLPLIKKEFIFN